MRALLRAALILALYAGIGLVGVSTGSTSEAATAVSTGSTSAAYTSGQGLTVESATETGRVVKLVVQPDALARPVRVSILLPADYASTTQRYPVLYLLHGTSGGADDWLDSGDAEAITAGRPLIVVMPDGGYDGNGGSWWTNWVNQTTALGKANWEDFHVGELIPWIDAHLRTVASRQGRAIAGLSQGGFGAFSYAARHPDQFLSAGSFSGAPDIAQNSLAKVIGPFFVGAIMTLDGVEPFAPFGDPVTDQVNWLGHNPATLVTNLRGMDLQLWTGDGPPGTDDTIDPTMLGSVPIEAITHASTHFFADAARAAGVPYRLTDYGPGTHTWPYWRSDLTAYLPRLMALFADPPAVPATVGYRSTDRSYAQWGWDVAVTRAPALVFTGFSGASRTGFTWSGADPATVTTPPAYAPGSSHRITIAGRATTVRADPTGRLAIALPKPPLLTQKLLVGIS